MRGQVAPLRRPRRFAIVTAGMMMLGLAAARPAHAQQQVDWTNETNVSSRGSSLEKVGGCNGCDDAGAVSRQMIRSGEGYAEFTVADPGVFWMGGLSASSAGARFRDIDYGFRFNGNGRAEVVENGTYRGADATYTAGDVFRVAVVRGRIQYVKNGRVLLTSQSRPNYPLVLAATIGSVGEAIQNARIDSADRPLATLGGYGDESYDLDINGDGVVSLGEWRGSRQQFNLLDVNRDRVLTARELAEYDTNAPYGGGYGGVGTSGQVVRVDAVEQWNDTGIFVTAGDTLRLQADGTVQLSPDSNDTATPMGSTIGRAAPAAELRQASAGTLIARIGNSGPILIGNSRTIRASNAGRLYLGVNDDYWLDNSGSYRVNILVEPR